VRRGRKAADLSEMAELPRGKYWLAWPFASNESLPFLMNLKKKGRKSKIRRLK
jgi:hypothetical protein